MFSFNKGYLLFFPNTAYIGWLRINCTHLKVYFKKINKHFTILRNTCCHLKDSEYENFYYDDEFLSGLLTLLDAQQNRIQQNGAKEAKEKLFVLFTKCYDD